MSISDRPYKTILKRNVNRLKDADAQETNIIASCVMAEVIRTTFGPLGMDKLILDPVDEVIITNDGATIVKNFDVRHPMAKLIDMLVRAQDDEAGDGTKTVVIYLGEFLRKALTLMDAGLKPSTIIAGYQKAAEYAKRILAQNVIEVLSDNDQLLRQIAQTAMIGKTVGAVDYFTDIALKSVRQVSKNKEGTLKVDIKKIAILGKQGESLLDSQLIVGMAIDKTVCRDDMPKRVVNAKIAVVGPSIEARKTKLDAKISIRNPRLMQQFKAQERQIVREILDKFIQLGVNVLLSRRDLSEEAQIYLSMNNILAVQFVRGWDLEKIAGAVGGTLITDFKDIQEGYLGNAELVEEVKIGSDYVIFIRGCRDPKALCIFLRGGTEHIVYEAERRMNDALCVLRNALEDRKIVVGGGAIEMELSKEIKNWSTQFSGKEQLAMQAFAEAFEVIPRTLIENAGLEPIDLLPLLREHHVKAPEGKWAGFDCFAKVICDMYKLGIYDTFRVKQHAINAADEICRQILNIDDVIHAKPAEYETPEEEENI
ncbi:MAG: thermosome subunit [Promethearchaeota archaeon]|nr:MAG: thermosome subunit [Candidatus Lokiarchaeota archaeon]